MDENTRPQPRRRWGSPGMQNLRSFSRNTIGRGNPTYRNPEPMAYSVKQPFNSYRNYLSNRFK